MELILNLTVSAVVVASAVLLKLLGVGIEWSTIKFSLGVVLASNLFAWLYQQYRGDDLGNCDLCEAVLDEDNYGSVVNIDGKCRVCMDCFEEEFVESIGGKETK